MSELSATQRTELFSDGLTLLPGAVPSDLIQRARRAINASIGTRGLDPEQAITSHCQELREQPVLTDVYNASSARELAESAIGPGTVRPVTSAQIALRFPAEGDDPARAAQPHLDGMPGPKNGVPPGDIANFTGLVGVFLADVPVADHGNFTIWPGSHHVLEEYFRAHGPQTLLDGMPPVDLGEPRQITGRAGDAVLVHYGLAHGISGNVQPDIRYALFFRLYKQNHEDVHWECMTDIWKEWDGVDRQRQLADRESLLHS